MLECRVLSATSTTSGRYPTIQFGKPGSFLAEPNATPVQYGGTQTLDDVVKFVGEQMQTCAPVLLPLLLSCSALMAGNQQVPCRLYKYTDRTEPAANATVATALPPPAAQAQVMDLVDTESATILAYRYMLDSHELLKGAEARETYMNFTALVAASHPVGR